MKGQDYMKCGGSSESRLAAPSIRMDTPTPVGAVPQVEAVHCVSSSTWPLVSAC